MTCKAHGAADAEDSLVTAMASPSTGAMNGIADAAHGFGGRRTNRSESTEDFERVHIWLVNVEVMRARAAEEMRLIAVCLQYFQQLEVLASTIFDSGWCVALFCLPLL